MSNGIDDDIVRRARARAILQQPRDPRQPLAFLEFQFCGCIGDGESRALPNFDFTHGEIYTEVPGDPTKAFTRQQNETLEAFRSRVIGELPIDGTPVVIFYSDDIQVPATIQ